MSFSHRVFRLLALAALLLAGVALLGMAASDANWQPFLLAIAANRYTALAVGGGLIVLALLFAVSGWHRKSRGRFLSFDNEGGRVNISTEAIADYLGRLEQEFPTVIRMKIRVVPLRGALDIVMDIRVKADPQIHEICETLQKRARESLANGLGIQDVRRVEVSVNEINSERQG
jgi:hypothetical protein